MTEERLEVQFKTLREHLSLLDEKISALNERLDRIEILLASSPIQRGGVFASAGRILRSVSKALDPQPEPRSEPSDLSAGHPPY